MNEAQSTNRATPWPQLLLPCFFLAGLCALFLFPNAWAWFIGPYHYAEAPLYPFVDMHGRLAAFEAHRQGIDILYHPNPFDPLNRTNIKPTWPLALSFLGLGPSHLAVAGVSAIFVFVCIIARVLRPNSLVEGFVYFVFLFSPPVLLGMERANDDLVYFSLLALVPLALRYRSQSHAVWLAWLVIFILAPAKYYPGAVFLVLLAEVKNWRQLSALLVAGVLFLGVYLIFYWEEVVYLSANVPKPQFFMVHGGKLAFELIGLSTVFMLGPILLMGLLFAGVFTRPAHPQWDLPSGRRRWFLLGASVFFFCFLLNSNYDYRFIYLLPTVPVLIRSLGWTRPWRVGALLSLVLLGIVFWTDLFWLHWIYGGPGRMRVGELEFVAWLRSALLWVPACFYVLLTAALLQKNIRNIGLGLRQDLSRFVPSLRNGS